MKKFGVVLALIAIVSLTLFPVTDSFAATSGGNSLIDQARRGAAVMISKEQMAGLAKSHANLHAKLMDAYSNQTAPKLTGTERTLLRQLSLANIKLIKAGQDKPAATPAANTPGGAIVVTKDVWGDAGKCVASAAAFGAAVAVAVPIAGIPVALVVAVVGSIGCAVYFFFPIIHDWVNANASAMGLKQ